MKMLKYASVVAIGLALTSQSLFAMSLREQAKAQKDEVEKLSKMTLRQRGDYLKKKAQELQKSTPTPSTPVQEINLTKEKAEEQKKSSAGASSTPVQEINLTEEYTKILNALKALDLELGVNQYEVRKCDSQECAIKLLKEIADIEARRTKLAQDFKALNDAQTPPIASAADASKHKQVVSERMLGRMFGGSSNTALKELYQEIEKHLEIPSAETIAQLGNQARDAAIRQIVNKKMASVASADRDSYIDTEIKRIENKIKALRKKRNSESSDELMIQSINNRIDNMKTEIRFYKQQRS